MEIVGRDRHLDELIGCLGRFIEDPVNLVCINGFPGTGKTTLLREFGSRVSALGYCYIEASAFPGDESIPFSTVEHLASCPGLPPRLVADLVRLVREGAVRKSFEALPADMLRSLCADLAELARPRPVAIGVDNVEYADPLSLAFLRYLARRPRLTRTLVVVTCDELPAQLLELPDCREVGTELLTERATRRMWELASGRPMSREAARFCRDVTGGSPLLISALMRDNSPTGQTGRTRAVTGTGGGDLVVGGAYVRACLGLLHRRPGPTATGKALAVLGADTTLDLAARVCDSSLSAVAADAERLTASGLVDGARFRHSVLDAAVQDAMEPLERGELHRRAAEALALTHGDVVSVARHHAASGERPAPAAVTTLCAGARELLIRGEPAQAADLLRAADRGELDERQRVRVLRWLVDALMRFSPVAAGAELHRLMTPLRTGLLSRVEQRRLIQQFLWHGRTEEATEVLERMMVATGPQSRDVLGDLDDPEALDDLYLVRERLLFLRPDLADRLPRPRSGQLDLAAAAYVEHALWMPVPGVELPQSAIGVPRPPDRGEDVVPVPSPKQARTDEAEWSDADLVVAYLWAHGDLAVSTRLCDAMLVRATRSGCVTYQALLLSLRADIALRRGDMTAAAEHALTALRLLPPEEWGVVIGWPLSILTTVAATGSDTVPASLLRQPVPEEMFATAFGPLYLLARGRLCLATGRVYAALSDLTRCGRLAAGQGDGPARSLPWRTAAGEAYLRLGRPDRARELAEEELARPGCANPRLRGMALRVLAAASAPTDRLPLLRRAAKALRECGDRYELARVLADLSHAERLAGNLRRADTAWRRARTLDAECGVPGALFPVRGAAPAGLATASALQGRISKAERRVAALATSGRSNRQIAERLYITVSTVEQHLTRVYRKLGVRSRTELSQALREEP